MAIRNRHLLLFCFLAAIACGAVPHSARAAKENVPRPLDSAESHLRVPFLQPQREWERIDVYVPKSAAAGDRLPCIILFYGGGWGAKNMGGVAEEIEPLLRRGYVVATPDYLLSRDPVPQAVWDSAAAVRFLRANAADYRIDPERIGVWGFSAGGWLVQMMAFANEGDVVPVRVPGADKRDRVSVPLLDPHPLYPDQSNRVQAVVTDWGAERVAPYASADDPPLLTYANPGEVPKGPAALIAAGAPCELAVFPGGTHVPSTVRTMTTDKSGRQVTLRERVHQFFDEHVKDANVATAPEILMRDGPGVVTIRSVHPRATIRYTTDKSIPTASSAVYDKPLALEPGTAVKAVSVVPGLAPSRVASMTVWGFGVRPPVIQDAPATMTRQTGEPLKATFRAVCERPVRWAAAGKLGTVADDGRWSADWLVIDAATGVLSGVPPKAGVYTFVVAAETRDGERVLTDARTVILTVGD